MKNILIVCKKTLFETQPSYTRVKLIEYLGSKSNIRVLDDIKDTTIEEYINGNDCVGWYPDVIMYYFLSSYKIWTDIEITDFVSFDSNVQRVMFFEDHHYSQVVIPLYHKYGFSILIKPSSHEKSEIEYEKAGINYNVWGFYIDANIFKDYRQEDDYKYDFLLYGFICDVYPLRRMIYRTLQYLQTKKSLRIHIIEHPGYSDTDKISTLPKNEELSKIISQSRFTFVTSSIYRLHLKKYMEVPMSGSTMIGDIPPGCEEELRGNIIEIPFNAKPTDIMLAMKYSLDGKLVTIEENSKQYGAMLRDRNNFESAFYELMNIIS